MIEQDENFIKAVKRAKDALRERSDEIQNIAQQRVWNNPIKEEIEELKTAKENVEGLEEDIVFLENVLNENNVAVAERTFKQGELLTIIRAAAQEESNK